MGATTIRVIAPAYLVHIPCIDLPAPTDRFVAGAMNRIVSIFDVSHSYPCIVTQTFKYFALPVPNIPCFSTLLQRRTEERKNICLPFLIVVSAVQTSLSLCVIQLFFPSFCL